MSKTHYRKVFKSDHLGVADLEEYMEAGHNLIFTIKEVKQEYGVKVAGKKIDANIAYFEGNVKPLVVNATNSKALKELCGGSPFVEDWSGLDVALYIDQTAKLKGEVVGGLRISTKKVSREDENTVKLRNAKTLDELKSLWENDCKKDDKYLGLLNTMHNKLSKNVG